jgi:hypothetical protein
MSMNEINPYSQRFRDPWNSELLETFDDRMSTSHRVLKGLTGSCCFPKM